MLEQPKYITVQHIVTAPGLVVGVFSFPLICAPLSTLSSILLPVTQKSVSVLKDVSVPKMHLEDTRQREEEACWRSLYSRCNLCFFYLQCLKRHGPQLEYTNQTRGGLCEQNFICIHMLLLCLNVLPFTIFYILPHSLL